jgi:hypothetical protein
MKGMGSIGGVIQGNPPITCHNETLSDYFDISIKDYSGVAIGFTDENFKKNELPTIIMMVTSITMVVVHLIMVK